MKTRRSHLGTAATAAVAGLTVGSAAVTVIAGLAVGTAAMATTRARPPVTGCSQRNPTGRVATNRWRAARHELAPPGPSVIRLCRYSGLDARPPLSLLGSALVRSARTRHRLVRRLDSLPPPPSIAACPNDSDTAIVAHLAYPRGRQVTVRIGLDGCRTATNGDVWRTAAGSVGDRLITQLERLTDPPRR